MRRLLSFGLVISFACALILVHVASAQVAERRAARTQDPPRPIQRGAGMGSCIGPRDGPQLHSQPPKGTVFTPFETRAGIHWPAAPKPNSATPAWSTAGKEFYACFLSVVGSAGGDADTRTLFLCSRAPAKVVVEILNTGFRQTVIVAPGATTRVDLPDDAAPGREDYEIAQARVVHVYSNEVLSVYGYSHDYLSSDGFVIYPAEMLGKEYVVASARNALNYNFNGPNPRSEFAVAATADNTTVTFKLPANSYSGRFLADSTYSLKLNRGQCYQLMARDTGIRLPGNPALYLPWSGGPDCDLTGSLISSDKPIAVFSGHERAASPSALEFDTTSQGPSRDHLIEQLLPVDYWGEQFVVVASGQDAVNLRPLGGDVVRVIAAFDGTTVTVNGVIAATLSRGGHYDFMSSAACTIASDHPVEVMKLMQTTGQNTDPLGDPDLTVVRPTSAYSRNYTLPAAHDQNNFSEPHLLVICDTGGIGSIRRNGQPLRGAAWKQIAGTPYAYGIFFSYASEQRIESMRPCYAEEFGFGVEDSYTYAGGGEFAYVDSLLASDLDFHTIGVGSSSDLSSVVHTAMMPFPYDTVLVYSYEWITGDTNNFQLLASPVAQSIGVAPNKDLSLPFRFHPDAVKSYSAVLRIWSSAANSVLVHLMGGGIAPLLKVTPDTIDFGRVRIGSHRDSVFTIQNLGSALILTHTDYSYSISSTKDSLDFTAQDLPGFGNTYPLAASSSVSDSVHFHPTKEGRMKVPINIQSTQPPDLTVVLIGTGIWPKVVSSNHDFGDVRDSVVSPLDTIYIVNRGSDSTSIDEVSIVNGPDIADFNVSFDTLPPSGRPLPIEIGYKKDTILSFTAVFAPKSLGAKTMIVRIHTTNGDTIFDTLRGRSVEPLVKLTPDSTIFPTILVPKSTMLPAPVDSFFYISNSGTMVGRIDSLVSSDDTDFHISLVASGAPVPTGGSIMVRDTFIVTDVGDFVDTIWAMNDTRYAVYGIAEKNYRPMMILRAKVRTGPLDAESVSFDTIRTCEAVVDSIVLHNPYPVGIHIDTILFRGQDSGFAYALTSFVFPINIPKNGYYPVRLQYSFPQDSLNGPQQLTLVLAQKQGAGEPDDTILDIVTLQRQQRVLTLHAQLPIFVSSANDIAALRLPITVEGPRDQVPDLDNFMLSLRFSNDLFVPDHIDTTGGLAVPGFPTGYHLQTQWDQTTRTYTIVADSTALADQTRLDNNLLFHIALRAYLTTDTSVTVTPTFTFKHHPCAYNLQPFTLTIPYADDCGDPAIRTFMRGGEQPFAVTGIWPAPVTAGHGGVTIGYLANVAGEILSVVRSIEGRETGRTSTSAPQGAGRIIIPAQLLPQSGIAFISLEVRDAAGVLCSRKTVKVPIDR